MNIENNYLFAYKEHKCHEDSIRLSHHIGEETLYDLPVEWLYGQNNCLD